MKIIKCKIYNFGKLNNIEINFNHKLSVIRKNNGWGKSTLAAFLGAMLFGFSGDSKRNIKENERKFYKPWQQGIYGGSLVIAYNQEEYIIERTFGDKASEDHCQIRKLSSNKIIAENINFGERIFGIDKESFKRTVFIGQDDCETVVTDNINAKIGNLVDNTNDINNYEKAMIILKEEINNTSGRKNNRLSNIKNEISNLKANNIREKQSLKTCEANSKKIESSNYIIEQEKERLLEHLADILGMCKNYKEAYRQEVRNKKQENLKNNSKNNPENKIGKNLINNPENNPEKFVKPLYDIFGILFIFLGAILMLKVNMTFILMAICGAVMLILPINGETKAVKNHEKSREDVNYETVSEVTQFIILCLKGFSSLKNEANPQGGFNEFSEEETKEIEKIKEIEELEKTDFFENAEDYFSEIIININDIARAQGINRKSLERFCEGKLEDLKDIKDISQATFNDIKKIIENVNQCIAENVRLENENRELKRSIRENGDRKYLEDLEKEKKEIEHKNKIAMLTRDYLSAAKENLTSKYMKPMLDSFNKYYSMICENEAENYRLDADMNITYQELGMQRQVVSLSRGNRDLAGICLRLAMVDAMYPEEKPFLIMDDSFVNLDDDRLENIFEFLKLVSKDFQLIYLTCHDYQIYNRQVNDGNQE